MHMFFRTLLHSLLSRFGPRLGHYDVARTRFITLPTDQDILRHMNNGVYLSIMDIARFDMLHRTGIWAIFQAKGWYPVVVSETISFRKSLTLGQRFTVESRILGFDEKAVYVEQRFVRPSADADGSVEVYARGFIRGRFLKRSGGVVTIDELIDAVGAVPDDLTVPAWLLDWSADVAMPATRAAAPSIWE
ncbi:thioesterase family protein [Cryobacterium sp. PAMC25264]|uniref:acyl-CoA thioesterase n=1 Tax=Cryobacterium sp. PAMC25264 TaxID=2861288 RepID=UPI001C63295E|nr:thioesterase family protein [Cryobacterium sp. PAMC25264]QYF73451.1 thioesterase family protein [Cryobacterium sp. PAMC25264]